MQIFYSNIFQSYVFDDIFNVEHFFPLTNKVNTDYSYDISNQCYTFTQQQKHVQLYVTLPGLEFPREG